MSDFKSFMKENKKRREHVKYAVTKSLCDSNGKPLEWTLKALDSKQAEKIRDSCMIDVPIPGKRGQVKKELDTTKYISKLICASIVEPNLNNAQLQDSYGVKTPEDLLFEMVDVAGEYNDLTAFVQELSGLNDDMDELVDEAKN